MLCISMNFHVPPDGIMGESKESHITWPACSASTCTCTCTVVTQGEETPLPLNKLQIRPVLAHQIIHTYSKASSVCVYMVSPSTPD